MDNSDVSHDGHRMRLLNLAVNAGIDSLSDIQMVEFMLTYIFPRGDVNPLAHRLIDAYGTLTNIIDASPADLMTIKGINDRSAKKISMLGELFFAYTTAKMRKKIRVENRIDILDLIEDMLRFRTTENMVFLAFSPAHLLCGHKRIRSDSSDSVSVSIMELTAFLASTKPSVFVVGHCHPYGSCKPSENDFEAFEIVKKVCFDCGVTLHDSYIVGEDGVYSMVDQKCVRMYYDIDALKSAFGK